MNKYKLLFDILKPKVGPDPARMIIYNVYSDDNIKYCKKQFKIEKDISRCVYSNLNLNRKPAPYNNVGAYTNNKILYHKKIISYVFRLFEFGDPSVYAKIEKINNLSYIENGVYEK